MGRLLCLGPLLLSGCHPIFLCRDPVAKPAATSGFTPPVQPHPDYRLVCGDVVEVRFYSQPQWDALCAVDLDGRLPLGLPVEPRVEGRTLAESQELIAQAVHIPPQTITVRLVEPRGQYLFVHGPIRGHLRMVPYQGPETVVDFLRRISGLPPGAQLGQVYVVRPRVADGQCPLVYRCDVRSVLQGQPSMHNIPLHPGDVIYIGETAFSVLARFLPDWLEPLYCRLVGLWPSHWLIPWLATSPPGSTDP
jgi:protein involved in polysaccharide export with SLBB domain